MSVPSEGRNHFSYKDASGILHQLLIEVQLSCDVDSNVHTHTWHIFLSRSKPGLANAPQKAIYYKLRNSHLYDAIVQSIHNYDLTVGSGFLGNCILRGTWDILGNVTNNLPGNKRAWYFLMFDNTGTIELTRELTKTQYEYIQKFI